MSQLAVVVATRDRAERLRALLASLEGQDVELFVVDDGSEDETPELLRRAGVRHRRLEPSRGPAAARNAGWRETGAPLVAFVDDDCVAQPGWAEALVAAAGGGGAPGAAAAGGGAPRAGAAGSAFVVGRTVPDPRELDRLGAFSRTQSVEAAGPYFQTCNIAYPRELLERLGGFDEEFSHFGEDTDLGLRAIAAGAEPRFAAAAEVHHAVHDVGPAGLVRGSQRWADAVRLLERHPGLRESLWLGVFWKRSHAPLLAGALSLAVRRPLLAAAAGAAWALTHRREHGSPAGLAAALPAHLAVDAAETVAMLRGSLRFRTLVL